MNGSGSILGETISYGKVLTGCSGPIGVGAAASTDPLSIGISLVLVFFVILLVAILVSFVVFRLRKQKKEKSGGVVHPKQNGGATLVAGAGPGDNGRGLHPESTVPSFMTDNGDVIRGVGGHHLVGPELISKR